MVYSTIEVDVNELLLDSMNPRFIIPPNSEQEDIIKYLLEFEEVVELAKGINSFGSLMPGERIIVCIEDGKTVVLEGNRRTCACKLLLNRNLIPEKYSRFPSVNVDTQENILRINVDLVPSRESAQSVLYRRHIAGVKRWSTISKQKFYANEFLNNKDLKYIAEITTSTVSNVKKGISGYLLTLMAVSLNEWTQEEKDMLDLQDMKVDPFLRVFTTKSIKYDRSALDLLKMSYDEKTFVPKSELKREIFEHCIFLIARAAFFNKEFNTRNIIDDVPGLLSYLEENNLISKDITTENSDTNETTPPDKDESQNKANNHNPSDNKNRDNGKSSNNSNPKPGKEYTAGNSPTSNTTTGNTETNNTGNDNKSKANSPKAPSFFHALTWTSLNPANSDHLGVILLADEIKKLSNNNLYGSYPVATAILLRSLFEQSLKYYTKFIGKWNDLLTFANKKQGFDPMLGKIIDFYKSNNNYFKFFNDRTTQSAFSCATEQSMLDFFDTIVHNTHIVKPTKTELENKAANGLFSLIHFILNCTKL